MIPLLPKWDNNDHVSKEYVGPGICPSPDPTWENVAYTLGPINYGLDGQHLAQRWWAMYSEVYDGLTYLIIVPANLNGSGWGRARNYLTFTYQRSILRLDFGFTHHGLAVVSMHHNDDFGPPNSSTVFHYIPDQNNPGEYIQVTKYLNQVQGCVIACDTPIYTEGVTRDTYIFYIDSTNQLCYVTYSNEAEIDFSVVKKSIQLGPTWEILHGGYRVDGKFQLAYRHDPGDDLPPSVVNYDLFAIISPPFKFEYLEGLNYTHAKMSDANITEIESTKLSDSVTASVSSMVDITFKSPLISVPVAVNVPVAPLAIGNFKITGAPLKEMGESVTLESSATKITSIKLTTVKVPTSTTDTTAIGNITISNVSLKTV